MIDAERSIIMGEYDFNSAKEEYRELCRTEESINIYMQDWFLDAALGGVKSGALF